MKIKFQIKEDVSSLIEKIRNTDNSILKGNNSSLAAYKNGKNFVISYDDVEDLHPIDFAAVIVNNEEIIISTATSQFEYRIFKEKEVTMCQYNGAYYGLLEQDLMVKLNPVFTGKEEVTSTTGETSLREYVTERSKQWSAKNPKEKKGSLPTPYCLKDMFFLTEEEEAVIQFQKRKPQKTTLGDIFKEKLASIL